MTHPLLYAYNRIVNDMEAGSITSSDWPDYKAARTVLATLMARDAANSEPMSPQDLAEGDYPSGGPPSRAFKWREKPTFPERVLDGLIKWLT